MIPVSSRPGVRPTALFVVVALLAAFASTASMAADESPYTPRQPLAKLDLKDGDTIVFLGDSITHQCLYTQYLEDYFYTRFPKMRLRLHNAGVGGARAWDALLRFDQDVASYKPKYVTVLLGMNDGHYAEYFDDVFNDYQKNMTRLLDEIQKTGATAIVMTPTMFDARAKRMQKPGGFMGPKAVTFYNATLAYYGAWLRDTAYERGLGFVDMWSPLNDITLRQRQKDPKFTMIPDSVHPDASGHVIMAVAVVDDLNLPRVVSATSLKLRAGKWSASGTSAEVTDVTGTANSVTFTSSEQALPWVLPAEAQLGVTLSNLGAAFGRETIQVSGLPVGEYSIQIDGQEVAKATADQLAAGLDLESNYKTPQYQQAAKVAELNKKRNEGPVKRLRNEWLNFQSVKFLAAQVKKNPGDEAEKKRLADAEKKMPGMDGRVKAAELEARKMEDEIFRTNQPKPHTFTIQPATKQ
jgi:lysophospholipase L1-like esterase